jgi:hypothetical protein
LVDCGLRVFRVSFGQDSGKLVQADFHKSFFWHRPFFIFSRRVFCKGSDRSGSFCPFPKIEFVVKCIQDCGVVFLQQSSRAFKVGCLTQRAPDKWDSARFQAVFLA